MKGEKQELELKIRNLKDQEITFKQDAKQEVQQELQRLNIENRSLTSQLDEMKSDQKRLREENEILRQKFQQLNDSLHRELQDIVEKSFASSERQAHVEASGRQGQRR